MGIANFKPFTSALLIVLTTISCSSSSVLSIFSPVESVSSKSFVPDEVSKIATLIQASKNTPQRLIEDKVINILMVKGYQVPSRSDIDSILEEMHLQDSDLTDDAAAEFGKLLNVPAVLIISVTQFEILQSKKGKFLKASMGARLISVEKSEVLWIGSGSNETITLDRGNDLLLDLSKDLAQKIPSRAG